jgi:hypothetical protein
MPQPAQAFKSNVRYSRIKVKKMFSRMLIDWS